MALLPTRISELNSITPLRDDQIPIARGSGPSGRTYKITVRDLIGNIWTAGDSTTVNLTYDSVSLGLSAEVIDNSINNFKISDMPANTVKVNNTATAGNPSDLLLPQNTTLARSDSNITALSAGLNSVFLRDSGNLRFVGGVPNQVLRFDENGVLGFGQVNLSSSGATTGVLPISGGGSGFSTQRNLVPIGAVMPIALTTAPIGWLICNGGVIPTSGTLQGIAAADLQDLRNALGTLYGSFGQLPDLRGYFVRGYGGTQFGIGANSDTTTSGTFGQKQDDTFEQHDHSYTITSGSGDTSLGLVESPTTANAESGVTQGSGTTGSAGAGNTETRPKNIAMLYCIKY